MNRAQKAEVANQALDVLSNNRGYWVNTSNLYNIIKYQVPSWCDQAHLRAVLNILRRNGTVSRQGEGKHKWKLAVPTWDRNYPLSVQAGATPVTDDPDDDPDDDDTEEKSVSDLADEFVVQDKKVDTSIGSEAAAEIQRLKNRVKDLEKKAELAETNCETLASAMDTLTVECKSLKEQMERQVKTLKIEKWDGKVIKLKDVVLPAYFNDVLDLAKARMNILLVGPAGCGKSTLAELIAQTLGLGFEKVGGSEGIQEHHLLGRRDVNITTGKATFVTTPFLKCFEEGGVCLLDEFDGFNANVMLSLNAALDRTAKLPLSNRPSKPIANKSVDFIPIATANTIGRGATRQYVGRNQLDEATLSRFRMGVVECYYDEVVEMAVCPNDDLRSRCQAIRKRIEDCQLRRIMDTRFIADAYRMTQVCEWSVDKCIDKFFQGWPRDERNKVER